MKRVKYLSSKVRRQIVDDYNLKTASGDFKLTLKEIAGKYEVGLTTVNYLAKEAKCEKRPQGGRKQTIPSPRVMKVLRDATEPGITLEEVGRRNPRFVSVNGRRVSRPLTKQRVSQIISAWNRKGNPGLIPRGYRRGDKLVLAGRCYTVVRYDDKYKGAAIDDLTGDTIDPFMWVNGAARSKRVTVRQ